MVNHVPPFLVGGGRGEFLGIVGGNATKCLAQSKIMKSRNNVREEDVIQKRAAARVSWIALTGSKTLYSGLD